MFEAADLDENDHSHHEGRQVRNVDGRAVEGQNDGLEDRVEQEECGGAGDRG